MNLEAKICTGSIGVHSWGNAFIFSPPIIIFDFLSLGLFVPHPKNDELFFLSLSSSEIISEGIFTVS